MLWRYAQAFLRLGLDFLPIQFSQSYYKRHLPLLIGGVIAHSEKGNPAQTKREWEAMGMRADTEQQKRRDTAPQCLGADAGL